MRGGDTLFVIYQVIALGTAGLLTFFDGYTYNAWNWLLVVPINLFLGEIWPIYWGLLRWVM